MDAEPKKNEYVSTSGIVFKLNKVSSLLIMDATKKIPVPAVPRVYLEDKGREEENPSDPNYLKAMEDYTAERGILTSTLVIAFGSEVSTLPDNYTPFDDKSWADDLEEFGVTVPIKGKARYAAWVKFHLLDNNDIAELIKAVMRFSGNTLEEDVAQATDSFRGDEVRTTA